MSPISRGLCGLWWWISYSNFVRWRFLNWRQHRRETDRCHNTGFPAVRRLLALRFHQTWEGTATQQWLEMSNTSPGSRRDAASNRSCVEMEKVRAAAVASWCNCETFQLDPIRSLLTWRNWWLFRPCLVIFEVFAWPLFEGNPSWFNEICTFGIL